MFPLKRTPGPWGKCKWNDFGLEGINIVMGCGDDQNPINEFSNSKCLSPIKLREVS